MRRIRRPLSVKILLWFFLNFAVLAAVFIILFNAQFHFNLNWLLTGSARANVERLRDTIAFDLNNSSPDQRDIILEHHSTVNQVRLTIYDDEGDRVAGPEIDLPQEIASRLIPPPRPPRPGGNPGGASQPSPSPAGSDTAPQPAGTPVAAVFGRGDMSGAQGTWMSTGTTWADTTATPAQSPGAASPAPPGPALPRPRWLRLLVARAHGSCAHDQPHPLLAADGRSD